MFFKVYLMGQRDLYINTDQIVSITRNYEGITKINMSNGNDYCISSTIYDELLNSLKDEYEVVE